MVLMIGDLTEYGKRKVEGDIPYLFPVVVRIDDRAQVVLGHNLTQYLKEHPDYSFLIPEHQTAKFKDQINSNTRANLASSNIESESGRPLDAFFTVKTIAPGKQALKVYATWNEDVMNVGWYEATDKEAFPQHHTTYFGPSLAFKEAPIAVLITLAIWIIVPRLIRRLRQRRQRRHTNGGSIQGQA
ncbi:MAG TPA: hypothetical protein VJ810_40320 [Blastocatellia bacterium]|nr:hypothetical protein [Blastocatellia bacterium]